MSERTEHKLWLGTMTAALGIGIMWQPDAWALCLLALVVGWYAHAFVGN